jgi:hypothetical protein
VVRLAEVVLGFVAARTGEHGDDRDERRQLLWRGVAADQMNRYVRYVLHVADPQVGALVVGARRVARGVVSRRCSPGHSGMFPCFLGGSVSRLLRRACRPRMTQARVWDGEITEST